jgi:hypothetical protein
VIAWLHAHARWGAGILAAALAFLIPLLAIGGSSSANPTVRVFPTGERLSALVIDGNVRVLLLNADDLQATSSALGRSTRPWEADPDTIIAPADDAVAPSIWQAIQITGSRQLLIAGVPGADPIWSEIERICRSDGIDLQYLSSESTIELPSLHLRVIASSPDADLPAAVAIERGETRLLVALDSASADLSSHALVIAELPEELPQTTVALVRDPPIVPHARYLIAVPRRGMVTVVIEPDRLRFDGGTLYASAD